MSITTASEPQPVVRPIMPRQSTYFEPTRLLAVAVAHALAEFWNINEPIICSLDETLSKDAARPAFRGDIAARIVKALDEERVLQGSDPANTMVSVVRIIILSEYGHRVGVCG